MEKRDIKVRHLISVMGGSTGTRGEEGEEGGGVDL